MKLTYYSYHLYLSAYDIFTEVTASVFINLLFCCKPSIRPDRFKTPDGLICDSTFYYSGNQLVGKICYYHFE